MTGLAINTKTGTCGPCAIRRRRTRSDMDAIRAAIVSCLEADSPMTIRQVFYRLVSMAAIDKTEGEYKKTVCRLLTEMRLDGSIPFGWIADNTRWMRKPVTHNSMEAALKDAARLYRRNLWRNQEHHVEIWLEKDALAGVLMDVTEVYDVPLMVTRGYPSLTYLYEAAEVMNAHKKPAFIYYFGDLDPSGADIDRHAQKRIREIAPKLNLTFQRVAVTRDQIEQYKLETRPTKGTDSRAKKFEGDSVEVDAIPSATLKALADLCITQHIDQRQFKITKEAEKSEREYLTTIAAFDWQAGEQA